MKRERDCVFVCLLREIIITRDIGLREESGLLSRSSQGGARFENDCVVGLDFECGSTEVGQTRLDSSTSSLPRKKKGQKREERENEWRLKRKKKKSYLTFKTPKPG